MSSAQAEGLTIPLDGTKPVILRLSDAADRPAHPSERLEVFVGELPCCDGRTPIAGRYELTDTTISFTPAFGFEAGQKYVTRFRTSQVDEFSEFQIPLDGASSPAVVTEVFPSGETLPENTLRFYIHFSMPMRPHVAFDYIKLLDANGTEDEAAFMRFKQELWNEDRTRLTVLMDPGRIKRNVATNAKLGPALIEENQYTLTIEAGWPSADGQTVLPQFTRRFRVGPPLRDLPRVDMWQATRPCLGTQGSLYVTFDRPFDRHLLHRDIRIVDEDGDDIDGTLIVGSGERSIIFAPNVPWTGDRIGVLVNPTLEDVAANNFRDLLDHRGSEEVIDVAKLMVPVTLNRCSG